MGKIVGKIFIIFLSFAVICLDARISMKIATENGTSNQVVVGQPFTLEVSIDDVYGSVQMPTIKGLDRFAARQSGSYMSSVNGRATARFSYQVRIDVIGSYVIGPAVVHHQQQEMISNEVRIDVVKDIVVATHGNKQSQATEAKAFLRVMVDSESVVVGQKIGCMIRFYYQDPSATALTISMPELAAFDKKEMSELEKGTAEIDGSEYYYAQWRWDMYPTKPGEFLIPAHSADYEIPTKDNHLFGGFFALLNSRGERKRVYSNAVTIKVAPIPHYDRPVHAVGVFERFSAEIKPGMAKEGEGMVMVIEVEGVGNLQAIAVPTLNMPKSLKYYDSNNVIIQPKHSDEFPKKRFEFIVQGMESGHCEIPEQLFTYFDTEKNAYVTLRTSPLAVSIMPGVMSAKKNIVAPLEFVEPTSTTVAAEEKIADINTVGQWYPLPERQALPWWLFQFLFLMPCLYVGYPLVSDKFMRLASSSRFTRRRAFKQARKQIELAIKSGNDKNLYAIFMQLFQNLGKVSQEMSTEWHDFFEQITHAAYAQSDNKNSDELCRMAKQWLDRLEKSI